MNAIRIRLEVKKDEVLTYRSTYILLASSHILLIIRFMVEGMGLAMITILPLLVVLTYNG